MITALRLYLCRQTPHSGDDAQSVEKKGRKHPEPLDVGVDMPTSASRFGEA